MPGELDLGRLVESEIERTLVAGGDQRIIDRHIEPVELDVVSAQLHKAADEPVIHPESEPIPLQATCDDPTETLLMQLATPAPEAVFLYLWFHAVRFPFDLVLLSLLQFRRKPPGRREGARTPPDAAQARPGVFPSFSRSARL